MEKNSPNESNTVLIKLSTDPNANPTLIGRRLKNGMVSLHLQYYSGYRIETKADGSKSIKKNRRTESLGLRYWEHPRTPIERNERAEVLALARRIQKEREMQLLQNAEGYRVEKKKAPDLIAWMWNYYESYTKRDKRNIKTALTRFITFSVDPTGELTPRPDWSDEQKANAARELKRRSDALTYPPKQLTKDVMKRYAEYLQRISKGEGAHTSLARFKKMVRRALEEEVLKVDPTVGVSIKIDPDRLTKDVLSLEEIQQLIQTHYRGESDTIRRAFIFCLFTGLRWCDVNALTYENIDYANRLLIFEQAKTKGHSAASSVTIPLKDNVLALIGEPPAGTRHARVFELPTANMCNKALEHWAARAGIEKHITWHCARHSLGTNLVSNGVDIKSVQSILGHSSLRHTEKYVRAVDSKKRAAMDSLPDIELG